MSDNQFSSKTKNLIGILVVILVVLLPVLIIRFCWNWVIPELFPGAVEQGLITGQMSWGTTVKLLIAAIILRMISFGNRRCGNYN